MLDKMKQLAVCLALWAIPVLLGYTAWIIVDMIWIGAWTSNWVMVLAGGILAYLFFGILLFGIGISALFALAATINLLVGD